MLTKGLIKNIGFQVVVAMVLGALVGAFMGEQATVFAPLGTLFIQLIKMLVIPLVAVAILSGAANLGASPAAGKIGVTTLAFFLGTSALAVLLGLGWVLLPWCGRCRMPSAWPSRSCWRWPRRSLPLGLTPFEHQPDNRLRRRFIILFIQLGLAGDGGDFFIAETFNLTQGNCRAQLPQATCRAH